MIRVAAIVAKRDGCTWWRVTCPYNAARAAGYPAFYGTPDDPATAGLAMSCDAIVYPRQGWQEARTAFEVRDTLHAEGKLLWGEYDDDVWITRHEQKSPEEMGVADSNLDPAEARENLAAFDGCTVTNERLRTTIHSFLPDMPVEVVPNAIPLGYWKTAIPDRVAARHPELAGHVTVGWAGGDRHDADVEDMARAWSIVAERTAAHFVILGHQPPVLVNAVPRDRLHQIGWLPLEPDDSGRPVYPVGVAQIDVACCSVAPTRFNLAKTPIKFYEATAAGAASVVSRTLYGPVVQDGRTGWIANGVDEWAGAIERLVKRRGERDAMVRRATRVVRERHSMESNWMRWPEAWARLHAAGVRNG